MSKARALVLASLVVLSSVSAWVDRSSAATADHRASCPTNRTVKATQLPARVRSYDDGHGLVGHGALWTTLPSNPSYAVGGMWGLKQPWFRARTGQLTIRGKRISTPGGHFDAVVPPIDSYAPTGFIPSNLGFSSGGCWKVTGRLRSSTTVLYVHIDGSKKAICDNLASDLANITIIDNPNNTRLADQLRNEQTTRRCPTSS